MSKPRTFEQIVQELVGSQSLTICQLQAQLEAAQAKIAELTPKPPEHEG